MMRPGPNITHLTDEEIGTGEPILGRIARMLRPYRTKMAYVAVAVVASAALASVAPFFTKAVFDNALFPTDGSGVDIGLLGWLVARPLRDPRRDGR